jgi:hypothetical protein
MIGKTLIAWAAVPAIVVPSPLSATEYFPPSFAKPSLPCGPGSRKDLPILSDFENKWYSGQLSAAQEPSLYEAANGSARPKGRTVRFTWLRTFHPPVVVRVEGLGTATPRLIAKQLSGAGGYEPGTISKRVERRLSSPEADTLAADVVRTGVFKLPAVECQMGGMDGAEWLIEGVDEGGYHFVNRWTPRQGKVRDLGLAMLALTGWQFEEIY